MLQRNPTSVTEMRQILNELGSVFARVTHATTRTTKPGEDYCGPTNPHPRDLRQFILFVSFKLDYPSYSRRSETAKPRRRLSKHI
jgi:hypothetical protein